MEPEKKVSFGDVTHIGPSAPIQTLKEPKKVTDHTVISAAKKTNETTTPLLRSTSTPSFQMSKITHSLKNHNFSVSGMWKGAASGVGKVGKFAVESWDKIPKPIKTAIIVAIVAAFVFGVMALVVVDPTGMSALLIGVLMFAFIAGAVGGIGALATVLSSSKAPPPKNPDADTDTPEVTVKKDQADAASTQPLQQQIESKTQQIVSLKNDLKALRDGEGPNQGIQETRKQIKQMQLNAEAANLVYEHTPPGPERDQALIKADEEKNKYELNNKSLDARLRNIGEIERHIQSLETDLTRLEQQSANPPEAAAAAPKTQLDKKIESKNNDINSLVNKKEDAETLNEVENVKLNDIRTELVLAKEMLATSNSDQEKELESRIKKLENDVKKQDRVIKDGEQNIKNLGSQVEAAEAECIDLKIKQTVIENTEALIQSCETKEFILSENKRLLISKNPEINVDNNQELREIEKDRIRNTAKIDRINTTLDDLYDEVSVTRPSSTSVNNLNMASERITIYLNKCIERRDEIPNELAELRATEKNIKDKDLDANDKSYKETIKKIEERRAELNKEAKDIRENINDCKFMLEKIPTIKSLAAGETQRLEQNTELYKAIAKHYDDISYFHIYLADTAHGITDKSSEEYKLFNLAATNLDTIATAMQNRSLTSMEKLEVLLPAIDNFIGINIDPTYLKIKAVNEGLIDIKALVTDLKSLVPAASREDTKLDAILSKLNSILSTDAFTSPRKFGPSLEIDAAELPDDLPRPFQSGPGSQAPPSDIPPTIAEYLKTQQIFQSGPGSQAPPSDIPPTIAEYLKTQQIFQSGPGSEPQAPSDIPPTLEKNLNGEWEYKAIPSPSDNIANTPNTGASKVKASIQEKESELAVLKQERKSAFINRQNSIKTYKEHERLILDLQVILYAIHIKNKNSPEVLEVLGRHSAQAETLINSTEEGIREKIIELANKMKASEVNKFNEIYRKIDIVEKELEVLKQSTNSAPQSGVASPATSPISPSITPAKRTNPPGYGLTSNPIDPGYVTDPTLALKRYHQGLAPIKKDKETQVLHTDIKVLKQDETDWGLAKFLSPYKNPWTGHACFNAMAYLALKDEGMPVNFYIEDAVNATGEKIVSNANIIPGDKDAHQCLFRVCYSEPKAVPDATQAAKDFQAMENERKKNGTLPTPPTRMFIPLHVGGNHGILACIERDRVNGKINITVIDSIGRTTGYKDVAEKYIEQIKKGFPSGTSFSDVVHNQVQQQDTSYDLNCGYHQVMNTMQLMKQDDVYSYIQKNKLKTRSISDIENFHNGLMPEAEKLAGECITDGSITSEQLHLVECQIEIAPIEKRVHPVAR